MVSSWAIVPRALAEDLLTQMDRPCNVEHRGSGGVVGISLGAAVARDVLPVGELEVQVPTVADAGVERHPLECELISGERSSIASNAAFFFL